MDQLQMILLLLIACSCSVSPGFGDACKESERKALLKFKGNDTVDSCYGLSSWVGQDCCRWKGVTCDSITSNVINLDLGRDLFPNHPCFIAGEVNLAQLLELQYLRYLDLSSIHFYESSFPDFFGSMRQLQNLNLSQTLFHGEVPQNLGNLTKLVSLDLSYACYHCKMEKNNLDWAFKLQNLRYLDLTRIDLSGALNTLDVLHRNPSLSDLILVDCQLGNSHQIVTKNSSFSSSSFIKHLDLRDNFFSVPFPRFIQNLTSIKYLDLSQNHFTSDLPSWLGNKRYLQQLNLGRNHLSGPVPLFIQNLSSIKYLDLSENGLNSSISLWLGTKRYLEHINLAANLFSGSFPRFVQNSSSIKFLDVSDNYLTSSIPSWLGNKRNLEQINLGGNNFEGLFPEVIKNLTFLTGLNLSSNQFQSSIPSWLATKTTLEHLDLSKNLFDRVEGGVMNLIFKLYRLQLLDLSYNQLGLVWPTAASVLPKQEEIVYLDLSGIGIVGPFLDRIGTAMPSLQSLILARNDINGSIPRSLCYMKKLAVLDLNNNKLSGVIPDCWESSQIATVELSSNALTGPIPNSLAKVETLVMLSLYNNSLVGELPLPIIHCKFMTLLDVGNNNLTGEIPPFSGEDSVSLGVLILQENMFTGRIPPLLCTVYSLHFVDFGSNNLTGSIPTCFGDFQGMMGSIGPSWGLSVYYLIVNPSDSSVVEVIKGQERKYTSTLQLKYFVYIDLSCNKLEGPIPTEITTLSALIGLNLSHNHLTGPIPTEIGTMESLEAVDLTSNRLSGQIPESMSSLHNLEVLNLSYNNLQGRIPTSGQFATFDPSTYTGNPGLCGDPLPKKCLKDPSTRTVFEDEEEDDQPERIWLYIVVTTGFATGFWGVVGSLVFLRKLRHAYFRLAEEICDWIYVRVAINIARVKRGR